MAQVLAMCAMVALVSGTARAQSTQPSAAGAVASADTSTAQLQLRANELLTKGDYAGALPLLEQVSVALSDQPDQLGPVMEEIRVCKRQIKQAAAGGASKPIQLAVVAPSAPPVDPNQAMGEDRKPHPAPVAGQTVDLAIKELGNFEYDAEKGGGIPDDVKKLEGCHIRTHGFMIPLDQAESISEFALVPSLFACCFGQPPQIQHTLVIHCPKGKAVSYFPDELIVEGTLHVSEQKDGGFIVSIFQNRREQREAAGAVVALERARVYFN